MKRRRTQFFAWHSGKNDLFFRKAGFALPETEPSIRSAENGTLNDADGMLPLCHPQHS